MKNLEFKMMFLGIQEKQKKDGSGTYNILKLLSSDDEVFEFFVAIDSKIFDTVNKVEKFAPVKVFFDITSRNGRGEIRLNNLVSF